jgi:hypothetical protein
MSMTTVRGVVGAAALAACAGLAHAQVVINEVFENPSGSPDTADVTSEYIELYGRPGTSLTGYAIALVKGGLDPDGNDIPGPGSLDDIYPEIDEAFALDGYELGPDGFFVIYNSDVDPFSGDDISNTDDFLTPNPAFDPMQPAGPDNKRFLNGASFRQLHIDNPNDVVGNLGNDGSSTYLLVRRRPFATTANGTTTLGPDYNFFKDTRPDVNFDGKLDIGAETPVVSGAGAVSMVEPIQIVDDVSWSNGGGKEYVLSSEQELSETPGFNPDGVSRLRFYLDNPSIGARSRELAGGGFEILATRTADEEWIYGEMIDNAYDTPNGFGPEYDSGVDQFGRIQVKGPTDPDATGYDGSCDPEPDTGVPNPACPPTGGPFLFTDIDVTGFRLTPAGLNDHPTDAALTQFRFTFPAPAQQPRGLGGGQTIPQGDFNFDGSVTADDVDLIKARLGATLDDTTPDVFDPGTPSDPSDDVPFDRYTWQGRGFQQTLMMLEMDLNDAGTGPSSGNDDAVTTCDVYAAASRLPGHCSADFDSNGIVDVIDLNILLSNFNDPVRCPAEGDATGDGLVNVLDLNVVLSQFNVCSY